MANRGNILQNLNQVLMGNTVPKEMIKNSMPADSVLFSTNSKEEYEAKLTQFRQQKALSRQWVKSNADNAMEQLAGYTAVKLMYRDADLMDGTPEIASALDIISEEACNINSEGKMVYVKSKSKRVQSILEDLFVNRLQIHTTLPMIARDMVKYGNCFMLLNLNLENGVMGWRKLPVYETDRIENGYSASYGSSTMTSKVNNLDPDDVKFVWLGHNENAPYGNSQIAHFRLLNDSFFLPYGCSHIHKARRAWRMWSMMEDSMLIYRLDKSIERRVYKIYVGGIDDADVPAYVNDIANNFKRTPIVDPTTGMVDLRKNFLDVSSDYFIPVRDENASNPIETLQGANNQTQMDDISYMQNKIFAALRVPKTFLNFQEAQGKGQNLSIMDIRFSRMVNRVQQFLLSELNKIAIIHLYTIGLVDDLTNFVLSMKNPSPQIEMAELEDLTKRIQTTAAALADPGIGMPIVSLHWALKKIMKLSDAEIKDMLCEMRLEKAMAAELAMTQNIIKKTGMFDSVDRIYGDYEAMNNPQSSAPNNDEMGGGPAGGGGMGADFSGGLGDLGMPGGEEEGEIGGGEESMDLSNGPAADEGTPMENVKNKKPLITERKERAKSFTERYFEMLSESQKDSGEDLETIDDIQEKTITINENVNRIFSKMDEIIEKGCEGISDDNMDEDEGIEDVKSINDEENE